MRRLIFLTLTLGVLTLLVVVVGFNRYFGEVSPSELLRPPDRTPTPAPVSVAGHEVTIAVSPDYPPYSYRDPRTGEGRGWDYAVWQELCRRMSCTPVFVETRWEGLLAALEQGQVRSFVCGESAPPATESGTVFEVVAYGTGITDERKQRLSFSTPFVIVQARILVRSDESRFRDAESLAADQAAIIGAVSGGLDEAVARQLVGASRVRAFQSFEGLVDGVIGQQVDAMIYPELAGQGYSGKSADQVKLVGLPVSTQQLGFVFQKQNPFMNEVNATLATMFDDGTMSALATRYFTGSLVPESEQGTYPACSNALTP